MLKFNFVLVASGTIAIPTLTIVLRDNTAGAQTYKGTKLEYIKDQTIDIVSQLSMANYSHFTIHDVSKEEPIKIATIKVRKQNPIVEIID